MKKRIHYYSDCPFFAGCENMLVNFFSSEKLRREYELSFSYRFSNEYEEGMNHRLNVDIKKYALQIKDVSAIARGVKNKFIRLMFRSVAHITLLRYWFILYNTYVIWRFFGSLGRIDLLHINNGGYPAAYSSFSAVFAAKLRGIRKIIYVANNIAQPYTYDRLLDYPLDRLIVKYSDVFVTGSKYAGMQLKKVLNLPPEKQINIHNGIKHRNVTETRSQTEKRLKIPSNCLLISVVAVLEKRKGHIFLIKAMQVLQNRAIVPMPMLLIEGKGGIQNVLMDYVKRNKLGDSIKFIGSEDNVMNLLSASDIVVLPSIENEDFPNIVIEAMGLGKTVVASRLSGTPEQIDHEQNGFLVDPGNIEELVDTLSKTATNPQLRKSISNSADLKFKRYFSAQISVQKYIDLYKKTLGD